ncbi:MAG TPA: restriction endonuclease, partial [Blastocatellia bacterium]|nr:restriction endonuclease [Blastocatellia bacterium]
MTKLSVTRTKHILPFSELSAAQFERLCLWLVDREGYRNAQYYGESGSDGGRDIIAYNTTARGEELWYFQCKRKGRVTSTELRAEVDKISRLAAGDPEKRPSGIVFLTSASVSAGIRDSIGKYCRGRYRVEVWTRVQLDERVKHHRAIIDEFFYTVPDAVQISASRQLPQTLADFTGREVDLSELIGEIRRGVVMSGVHGMGGIGKTALAVKLAQELTPCYPDGQLCVSLKGMSDTPTTVSEIYAHIIRTYLGPETKLPEDEGSLRGMYNSVMDGKRALLLLDNAKDSGQIMPFAPPPPGCLLIVTSRKYFELPGFHPRNLDVMTPDDAQELLLRSAPRIGPGAERLAELCGRLPLALRAAASYLANFRDQSPSRYADRLQDERTRLEVLGAQGGNINVEASLGLSYLALGTDEAAVFRKLAVFPVSFDGAAAGYVLDDEDNVRLSKLVNL